MAKNTKTYDLNALIRLLGDQMNAVAELADEALPIGDQLKLLDTIGKTCSRLAALIGQQRTVQGDDSAQLNQAIQQVMKEMRKADST